MENNVLNMNGSGEVGTTTGSTLITAASGTGVATDTTVNAGGVLNCWPYYDTGSTSTYIINQDLTVKRAMNGYVVTLSYNTYIAKNEKDLNKLIVQLLNPKKGKKNG